MDSRKVGRWVLPVGILAWAVPTYVQASEGAPLTADPASQECLQLKDADTWSRNLSYLGGVGTVTSLATFLKDDLSEKAVSLTDSTHPPLVGYHTGIRWTDADMRTLSWFPQGLTTSVSGSTDFAVVSWHSKDGKSSRVSIIDTTNMADVMYRNVILVNPTGAGQYEPVGLHVGGLALAGHYLYVTDAGHGFRVFDLNQLRRVDGSNDTCSGHFGSHGGSWCADGYAYMLPQVSAYEVPSHKSNGAAISDACQPKFSWAGNDPRPSPDVLLSGEYCAPRDDKHSNAENESRECNQDETGLNGRLYQWPLGSDNKLVTSGLYVTPKKAYRLNVRNVQGAAPDMLQDASGKAESDTYWLSSTARNGSLYKVSPAAKAREVIGAFDDPKNPHKLYAPEGLHATLTSGHLWLVTEGQVASDNESENTNPATGGRVYLSIEQSAIH